MRTPTIFKFGAMAVGGILAGIFAISLIGHSTLLPAQAQAI